MSSTRRRSVNGIQESWVRDVEFVWRDTNYWSVLFVQFLDFEYVLARLNDIVVEFIPPCESGDLWTRDVAEGMEIESVDGSDESE